MKCSADKIVQETQSFLFGVISYSLLPRFKTNARFKVEIKVITLIALLRLLH